MLGSCAADSRGQLPADEWWKLLGSLPFSLLGALHPYLDRLLSQQMGVPLQAAETMLLIATLVEYVAVKASSSPQINTEPQLQEKWPLITKDLGREGHLLPKQKGYRLSSLSLRQLTLNEADGNSAGASIFSAT